MMRTKTEHKALGDSFPPRHCRAMDRFIIRPDRDGFSVYDVVTGAVAVIAMSPQTGLSRVDAEHTAELLNRRASEGERPAFQ
jgi:hypothetical protein